MNGYTDYAVYTLGDDIGIGNTMRPCEILAYDHRLPKTNSRCLVKVESVYMLVNCGYLYLTPSRTKVTHADLLKVPVLEG